MVALQCSSSVTKYWLIKMMLRERKRKWCDLQSPRIDARRALVGCSLSLSVSLSIWIWARKRRRRGPLPPITFVYHIYLQSFSFFVFFNFAVEARRKKGFVNWKRERGERTREREIEKETQQTDRTTDSPLKRFCSLTWSSSNTRLLLLLRLRLRVLCIWFATKQWFHAV